MTTTTTSALLPVYAQFPVRPVSAHGSWIVDERGERWLDAYGGHAVASTGHSHPHVVQAIAAQASQLLFYSTVLPHPMRDRMRPKVEACIRAATSGVERTHIIDGRAPDALLLEVFTGAGCGTMIVGRKEKATYLGVDLAG